MNKKIVLVISLILLLIQCRKEDQGKTLIPEQTGDFVWIYKPSGDHFFGPDTELFKEGAWYEDWVPNDHTFIQGEDGKWHIFGITHPFVAPEEDDIHQGEYASFHAVSSTSRFGVSVASKCSSSQKVEKFCFKLVI